MLNLVKFVFGFCIISITYCNGKFPSVIKKCNFNDSNCIVDQINAVHSTYYSGVPDLHLPSLDPFKVDSMQIVLPPTNPISMSLYMKNLKIYGFSSSQALSVSGFTETPKVIKLKFKTPKILMIGQYTGNGKIFVLPFQGNGISNITIVNSDNLIKFVTKLVNRNGKEYLQVEKVKVSMKPDRFWMNMDNLFDGNQVLGNQVNQFANENWRLIFEQLHPSIAEAFQDIYKVVLNNVFSTMPYREMFA